jgi:hypothetical protein
LHGIFFFGFLLGAGGGFSTFTDTTHPNSLQSVHVQWEMLENPKSVLYFQKGKEGHFLCIS